MTLLRAHRTNQQPLYGCLSALIAIAVALITAPLSFMAIAALATQDKGTVKSPNEITFAEFKGYETWQDVAVSETDHGIKAILGNPTTINAYKEGIPYNGKPVPDGSVWVKVEWTKELNPESPDSLSVPGILKSVSFIEKDSKRFPDTSGYGYAQFLYDASSGTFSAFGNDSSFGKTVCYQCHTSGCEGLHFHALSAQVKTVSVFSRLAVFSGRTTPSSAQPKPRSKRVQIHSQEKERVGTSNIAHKVVVITGASSGIGDATARLLAGNGARVVLGARRKGG